MSNFLITKFKSRQSSVTYIKDATQNDLFRNSANANDTKKVMDFMCSPTYAIHAVKRLADGVEFEVSSTRINFDPGNNNRNIDAISIENGEIRFKNFEGSSVLLTNAVLYTTPPVIVTPTSLPSVTVTNNSSQTAKDAFFMTIQNNIITANPRALRLRGLLRNRGSETLKQFLTKFFTEWNNPSFESQTVKDTLYVDDLSVQTVVGKRRSIGDLYMICKYYFPNVTVKQVYNCLMNELPTSITTGFRSSYCTTINKYVWYYTQNGSNNLASESTTAEYGHTYSQIKQKLS